MTNWRILLAASAIALLAQPLQAREEREWPDWSEAGWDAATLFAVIDKNEWCAGGSVHVNLWTGDYVLTPRAERQSCFDRQASRRMTAGTLPASDLARLRAAYRVAAEAGLRKWESDGTIVLSNGGPELLVVSGPSFTVVTPEAGERWSEEARMLHDMLFEIFGAEQLPTTFDDLAGRRNLAPQE